MNPIHILTRVYLGFMSDEAYANNKAAIAETNYRFLLFCTRYSMVAFGILTIAALFLPRIHDAIYMYLSVFLLMVIAWVIAKKVVIKNRKYACIVLYAVVTLILCSTIILGTFLQPMGQAAAYIGVLAVFPSQILDKPGRVMILTTITTIIFCVLTYVIKSRTLAIVDITNAGTFLLIGIFALQYTARTKMSNIISNARLEWNDLRYRSLLLDTKDVIFDYNPETKCCSISNKGNEYSSTGFHLGQFDNYTGVYPEDKPHLEKMLNSLNDHSLQEMRFYTTSGEVVWVKIHTIRLMEVTGSKTHIVGRLTNINERKRKEEILLLKAQTDSLTGLFNKTATEALITNALDKESCNGCAMILADVDDLKKINDTLGHAQGDRAILGFANTLKDHFRSSDIIGRVGGDEFMIYLNGKQDVNVLSNEINAFIRKIGSLYVGENNDYALSGSIGIARQTSKSEGFENLYKMADTALYEVKKSGKGTFCFYVPYGL